MKIENGMVLNAKAAGLELYEVEFTPKGTRSCVSVFVYAKSNLDASNSLIRKGLFGKQHSVRFCNVNRIHD